MTTPSTQMTTPSTRKRSKVLIVAAALMLLAAGLSLASPFLPRMGGFGGGMGPGGAPPPNGQAAGGAGQPPADGQASGRGQPPANGQGFGAGGPGGISGFGGMQTNGTFSVLNLMMPLRIAAAVMGGLLALLAALGLWRLKKWGRNLALVMAVAGLISVAAAFISPALGRSPWLMLFTGSTWQAIAGFALALVASILALLPVARQAYIVKPKERRVA